MFALALVSIFAFVAKYTEAAVRHVRNDMSWVDTSA
jgi:hypothetical protein